MKDIIIWVCIWYTIWGLSNILLKGGWVKNKQNNSLFKGLFFIFAFLFIFYFFKDNLIFHLEKLVASFIIINIIGLVLSFNKKYFKNFDKDRLFILFQSFNILYQQSSVVVVFFLIKQLIGNSYIDL